MYKTTMAKPWQTIDQQQTEHGMMVLLKRGEGDFLIKLDNYILMNSLLNLSEITLAESTCELLQGKRCPSVLIGGLGMGCTLRAALDTLPEEAQVVVAEEPGGCRPRCVGRRNLRSRRRLIVRSS